jgi:hypothetical protein
MLILNLGCGTKTCSHPDVTNVDFSIYLRMRKSRVIRALAPLLIKGERLRRFNALPGNFVAHNLAAGIPFPDNSADAVYHVEKKPYKRRIDLEDPSDFLDNCVLEN